jgi:hypothetical protein
MLSITVESLVVVAFVGSFAITSSSVESKRTIAPWLSIEHLHPPMERSSHKPIVESINVIED